MKSFDLMPYLDVPNEIPKGYIPLSEEPSFNPSRDLQLAKPEKTWTMEELGYSSFDIAESGSSLAFTEPFQILSEEGVLRLQEVVRLLRGHSQGGGSERSESNSKLIYVAGGVYRSRFLRDLCGNIEIAEFLSELAGIPLAPHSLPSQQIYINYPPDRIDEHVDRWHADSIGFDYVMMVTDPAEFEGGEFDVFLGTTTQAGEILGVEESRLNLRSNRELPAERIIGFKFPAAGYGIFQQGFRVVHRARRLNKPGNRITVVPGYVSRKPHSLDVTDLENISTYTEEAIGSEIIRHGIWRCVGKLVQMLDPDVPQELQDQRRNLRNALHEAEKALNVTRSIGGYSDRGNIAEE